MNARVLIVDDSMYMRTILKNILTEAGLEVVGEAGKGEEGYALAEKLNPDLITLDNIMPDINGLDVLRRLKQGGHNAKVVMISAVGQDVMIQKAKELGANSYITKPFLSDTVIETLDEVLA